MHQEQREANINGQKGQKQTITEKKRTEMDINRQK